MNRRGFLKGVAAAASAAALPVQPQPPPFRRPAYAIEALMNRDGMIDGGEEIRDTLTFTVQEIRLLPPYGGSQGPEYPHAGARWAPWRADLNWMDLDLAEACKRHLEAAGLA